VRYLEAGSGPPLVFVTHDPDVTLTKAHALLAEQYRIMAFGLAGIDNPLSMLTGATRHLGLEHFNLWGGAAGCRDALALATANQAAIDALVLEAPPALDDDNHAGLNLASGPALVVYGTRDTVVPPESGRAYKQHLPNCQYVLVYAAGHSVSADRPEAFASLVGDFLDRREAFIVTQKSSLLHP
jgi:pimeloyl-ACP methyl ester carboxylesterase